MTLAASSAFERIGDMALRESGICEIHVPHGVRELCHGCFPQFQRFTCVRFGASPSRESVGDNVFDGTGFTSSACFQGRCQRLASDCRKTDQIPFKCQLFVWNVLRRKEHAPLLGSLGYSPLHVHDEAAIAGILPRSRCSWSHVLMQGQQI